MAYVRRLAATFLILFLAAVSLCFAAGLQVLRDPDLRDQQAWFVSTFEADQGSCVVFLGDTVFMQTIEAGGDSIAEANIIQGEFPHGWLKGIWKPLGANITVYRNDEIIVMAKVKRWDPELLNPDVQYPPPRVNIGVALFFEVYGLNYSADVSAPRCLILDAIFDYRYWGGDGWRGRPYGYTETFDGTPYDKDYHYIQVYGVMEKAETYYEFTASMGDEIARAVEHFGLEYPLRLKAVCIYLEAVGARGRAEWDYVRVSLVHPASGLEGFVDVLYHRLVNIYTFAILIVGLGMVAIGLLHGVVMKRALVALGLLGFAMLTLWLCVNLGR